MECLSYLRSVRGKVADGKTAFENRYGKIFDGPSNRFGILVEYIPITAKDKSRMHQFGQKTLNGIVSGYVLRAGRGWSSDLMIADYEDLQDSEASEIYVTRKLQIFVRNRNFETSKSSRETLRGRWCWNRRRRQKRKQVRRCMVHEWRISHRHHEELRLKLYDPDNETFLIPLNEIRRRSETNSDKYKQCLWHYYQWCMDRSEWCHSFSRVDWDCKIPDPTCKASWRKQVRWSWDTIIQEETNRKIKLQNVHKNVPNCKQYAAAEESARYWPMTKITSRWLLMLVWNW